MGIGRPPRWNLLLLERGDLLADSFRGPLHTSGDHLQTGKQFIR
jgi:hypothetical protein